MPLALWCGRGDLNPYGLLRQILSLVRLPISPLPRSGCLKTVYRKAVKARRALRRLR